MPAPAAMSGAHTISSARASAPRCDAHRNAPSDGRSSAPGALSHTSASTRATRASPSPAPSPAARAESLARRMRRPSAHQSMPPPFEKRCTTVGPAAAAWSRGSTAFATSSYRASVNGSETPIWQWSVTTTTAAPAKRSR